MQELECVLQYKFTLFFIDVVEWGGAVGRGLRLSVGRESRQLQHPFKYIVSILGKIYMAVSVVCQRQREFTDGLIMELA